MPTADPPAEVARGQTVSRLYCRRLRLVVIDGRRKSVPCGRPHCSAQCRRKWARRWSACLRRSFRERPPTHALRVTGSPQALGRFVRRLSRRGIEYLSVTEWHRGHRHVHLAVLAPGRLFGREVARLWRESMGPGERGHSYCSPVRDPDALARYLVKDVKSGGELAPAGYRGRLLNHSRGFFVRLPSVLWREVRDGWFGKRAGAPRERALTLPAAPPDGAGEDGSGGAVVEGGGASLGAGEGADAGTLGLSDKASVLPPVLQAAEQKAEGTPRGGQATTWTFTGGGAGN
jgi:hypothetical protein